MRDLIVAHLVRDESASAYEKQYSDLLNELGFDHERGVVIDEFAGYGERLLSLDMACKERKIAVEFDGKQHFLTLTQGVPLLAVGS